MIDKINFVKLFGRFDYEIVFKPEGVTIITGPNGYGKSTILRCIEALSEGNFLYFSQLNFESIEIFSDTTEKKINITKKEDELFINKEKFPIHLFVGRDIDFRPRPYIVRIDDDRVLNKRTGEVMNIEDYKMMCIYEDNAVRVGYVDESNKDLTKYKDIRKQIKSIIGPIYFIKEQRLLTQKRNNRSEPEIVNVIEELPNKFKNLIRNISSNYSSTANKLDSTYPNRLFNTESGISEDEYQQKILEMTNKFEKLSKYDISEMQNRINVFFKEEHAKALKIYFDDFNEKYKVYEDFIKKLDLFTDIVNDRLSFKEIKISRENGIIIIDSCKGNNLKLNQLSSGEKQEIVLFYELIFETASDVLLLIDEPEISLHIVWQKMFMDDLLKIVEYKGLKVIVATHSPQIINNHWDIQIDLGDLYGDKFNKN